MVSAMPALSTMTGRLSGAWLLALFVVTQATIASAEWRAANPEVEAAAKNPRIAAVLAEATAIDAAIVAGDKKGFISRFAPEAVVNSPFNTIADRAEAERRFQTGLVAYEYLRRLIDRAALRRDDEVVLMGEETYKPRPGALHAGKVVRRRFTDIWRLSDGKWLLSLRQATIFSME